MIKSAFLILIVLVLSVVGGGASVWYALASQEGLGAVTVGSWTAFPDIGTPDADPYSKARIAREGALALGRAEGLSFVAQRDADGAALQRDCDYRIEGTVPASRFWTVYAAAPGGAIIRAGTQRAPALQSYQLLRQQDDSLIITASAHASPGNWLALSGTGPMLLVVNLYDTPIASSTGLADITMPRIVRVHCDG